MPYKNYTSPLLWFASVGEPFALAVVVPPPLPDWERCCGGGYGRPPSVSPPTPAHQHLTCLWYLPQ